MPATVLAVKSLTKAFAGIAALENVSLQFASGEIHAVVGENGAGKSTLMRLLTGELQPDSGSIERQSDMVMAMVHQHFMLVPAFTVAENLALTSSHRSALLNEKADLQYAIKVANDLGWRLDPNEKVGSMPVGARQRLEILRALARKPDILILDEPTAVLAPSEVEEFLEIMRQLKTQGKTVLLIAHKLDEVLAVADRITVLRGGKLVGTYAANKINAEELAFRMLGEASLPKMLEYHPTREEAAVTIDNLKVKGDEGNLAVAGITETIRKGEVLGLGGVDGNGQVELAEAIAGIRQKTGTIAIGGNGEVAYIPQDRQRDGLALDMTILDNFAIEGHRRFKRGPFVDFGKLKNWALQLISAYRIKSARLDATARTLSGGNQQKIVVSRVLDRDPNLIVAVNPTRGLDVRAAGEVLEAIRARARAGSAVMLISTDRDELAALADRTRYLGRGRLFDDFESALSGDWT